MTDEEIHRGYEEYAKEKPFPLNLEYDTFRAGVKFALISLVCDLTKNMSDKEIDELLTECENAENGS